MMITTRSKGIDEAIKRKMRTVKVLKNWDELKKMGPQYSRDFPVQAYKTHEELCKMNLNVTWKDKRCFVIGGGPSLRGFDFSSLKGEHTIAVNRAFEYLSSTIIFFMDNETFYKELMSGQFGKKAKERFIGSKALKISLNIEGARYEYGVYSVPMSKDPQMTTDLKDGLFEGDNSGYAALNLAVCLGANPIYLLGFDMKSNGTGKQSWFHSGYRSVGKDYVYKKWIRYFEEAVPIIDSLGIKVINLNPDSALRCFEFGEFEKIKDSK